MLKRRALAIEHSYMYETVDPISVKKLLFELVVAKLSHITAPSHLTNFM